MDKRGANALQSLGDELLKFSNLLCIAISQKNGWRTVWNALDSRVNVIGTCSTQCKDLLKDVNDALKLFQDRLGAKDWKDLADRALETSEKGLRKPSLSVYIPVGKIRYTHDKVAETSRHGKHAGKTKEQMATLLIDGEEDAHCSDWVLDVVRYNGQYCLLNNQHLWSLLRFHQHCEETGGDVVEARARIWPLNNIVKIHSCSVLRKFTSSLSTKDDGWSVHEHGRSATLQPMMPNNLHARTPSARPRSCTPIRAVPSTQPQAFCTAPWTRQGDQETRTCWAKAVIIINLS